MRTRLEAVQDAMRPWMMPHMTPRDLPAAFAAGIEAGLAWHEGDEVLKSEGAFVTEEEVITGAHQHRCEKELEGQLDTVLRYVAIRDGWITANDVDGQVEFRNLALEVRMIAEMRKILRGD